MAIKISGTNVVDDNSHPVIGSGVTRPASPVTGTLWFNTTLGVLEGWNGTSWIALTTA